MITANRRNGETKNPMAKMGRVCRWVMSDVRPEIFGMIMRFRMLVLMWVKIGLSDVFSV